MKKRNPQLNKNGELIHLLSTEGLSREILTQILDTAGNFVSIGDREVKKVPLLRGKSVFNLFFENSTRTRTTFEIAAKRLSADVFNLDIARSSTAKGESLLDTIANLSAMAADIFVVRHGESGAPYLIAQHVAPHVHVVNAGDGRHAHPTQGLLDMYTIRHYKKDFTNLSVAIVGDVLHSRVARSNIWGLTKLGAQVIVCGPPTLIPIGIERLGVPAYMVDDASELQDAWFEGRSSIGVTAGASAPEDLVQGVVQRLKALGAVSVRSLDGVRETTKFPLPKGLKIEADPA